MTRKERKVDGISFGNDMPYNDNGTAHHIVNTNTVLIDILIYDMLSFYIKLGHFVFTDQLLYCPGTLSCPDQYPAITRCVVIILD